MPAQNVAGSMTSSAIETDPRLKIMNPELVRESADSSHAMKVNDPLYTGIVAAAATPMTTCTTPRKRTGSSTASTRRRTHSPAEREAQDEARQHQLEGVGGGTQHQAQHADPDDLVDERREPGEEARWRAGAA